MDESAKEKVRELLALAVLQPPKHVICSQCGSVMQHMMTTFTFGDDENWTLPLPVCVRCDSGFLQGFGSQTGTA